MNDFSLDKSRWYNVTSIERASRWVRDDAKVMTGYAEALAKHHAYDSKTDQLICDAETALTEALLAVKLSKSAYQAKRSRPTLQAAE